MIFSKTIALLLSGRKTQTLRLAYPGDELVTRADGSVAVFEAPFSGANGLKRRVRWQTGRTYAIQRERCRRAEGRFLCTYLREVLNPLTVDEAFARAEGFDTVDEYLRVWHELHGKKPLQRCWAIGIQVEESRSQ